MVLNHVGQLILGLNPVPNLNFLLGARLKVPIKSLSTILLGCTGSFRGGGELNSGVMIPRGLSLSDGCSNC